MKDTYKHKGLRKLLVKEIREMGIESENVLNAIEKVPRHLFIEDTAFETFAYQNIPFPIGFHQTISQPYTVAFQTQLLQLKKGDKVLEIGTGCGYQTSILLEMGVKVYSIERIKELHDFAKRKLTELGYKAKLYYGDGYKGIPQNAPFDKIIVTAGAPFIPKDLLNQLAVSGRMVIPVGKGQNQIMTVIEKFDNKDYKESKHGLFSFVPLIQK